LREHLQREQVSDAIYLPITVELAPGERLPASVLDLVRGDIARRGITHVGVGAHPAAQGRSLVTVVMVRRLVELSAFPRELALGASQNLWARPAGPRVDSPRFVLAIPRGDVLDLPAVTVADGARAEVRFDHGPGRYVLQVLADDAHGPQVTNTFDVWVGQPAGRVERIPPAPMAASDTRSQERYLLEQINRFRAAHGLPTLALDPALSLAARAHSADMRDGRFFGHRSPVRGSLAERLARAGLPGLDASENIAMSLSAAWAHDGLTNSPAHRRVLLDPEATHVGVGVVSQRSGGLGVVYVTEIVASRPPGAL
jgi:uncharacterized protein YkwD